MKPTPKALRQALSLATAAFISLPFQIGAAPAGPQNLQRRMARRIIKPATEVRAGQQQPGMRIKPGKRIKPGERVTPGVRIKPGVRTLPGRRILPREERKPETQLPSPGIRFKR